MGMFYTGRQGNSSLQQRFMSHFKTFCFMRKKFSNIYILKMKLALLKCGHKCNILYCLDSKSKHNQYLLNLFYVQQAMLYSPSSISTHRQCVPPAQRWKLTFLLTPPPQPKSLHLLIKFLMVSLVSLENENTRKAMTWPRSHSRCDRSTPCKLRSWWEVQGARSYTLWVRWRQWRSAIDHHGTACLLT